jgi:uncharacterized membrane protein required for colicin V production
LPNIFHYLSGGLHNFLLKQLASQPINLTRYVYITSSPIDKRNREEMKNEIKNPKLIQKIKIRKKKETKELETNRKLIKNDGSV